MDKNTITGLVLIAILLKIIKIFQKKLCNWGIKVILQIEKS